MDMIDLMVGNPAVVLQDVVVLGAGGQGDLLGYGLCVCQTVCHLDGQEVGRGRTRISANESSGMSVNFAPWCFGMMSYGRVRCGISVGCRVRTVWP